MIRTAAIAAFWSALAFAQDTTGIIQGRVTDPSGAALGKAAVEVLNPANGDTRKQQLGSDGGARLVLPAGSYDLSVAAPGFGSYRVHSVVVNVQPERPPRRPITDCARARAPLR